MCPTADAVMVAAPAGWAEGSARRLDGLIVLRLALGCQGYFSISFSFAAPAAGRGDAQRLLIQRLLGLVKKLVGGQAMRGGHGHARAEAQRRLKGFGG